VGLGDTAALVWLVPCGLAIVYLCVLIAQLPHDLWEIGWSSDFASGFTVPATLAETGTGGHTVLAGYPLYVPLWFGLLTAGLPLHRQLWELAPTALFAATALIIGWSVAQVATRRAAALAVLMVLVASPAALRVFMAAVSHNTTYPCTALLGAYLIWLTRGDGRRRALAFAAPLLAALLLGVCLASDLLLVPTGVLPFALTALLACLRRDRRSKRLALSALTTVALALPIAELTSALMSSQGYTMHAPPLKIAPLSWLPRHAQLLLSGLQRLFNGSLESGASGASHAALVVACEVVMVLALLTLLAAGIRSAASLLASRRRADSRATPTQTALAVHVVYWVSSATMACGAFAFSTFLAARDEAFYVTVTFSAAAVIPLFLRSRSPARWLVPLGASICFAASLVGLTGAPIWGVAPLAHYEPYVLKLTRTYDAAAGYAGYWDASSLTWSSGERIKARPVFACLHPPGANLCIFSQETVPSWYAPRRQHSFLLIDADEYYVRSLPEGLGRPLAAYAFGPIRMYIYPYDIASRLGPETESPIF
jgi:hypothetical protein